METAIHIKRFDELTLDELYALLHARMEVFVVEQGGIYQDLDYDDQPSIHLWLTAGDEVVAVCRVCPAGVHMSNVCIGRVVTTRRGEGYGKRIMLEAIRVARDELGATVIDIEAQEYAKGFYEKVGFRQTSGTFQLDGLPHIQMRWTDNQQNKNL